MTTSNRWISKLNANVILLGIVFALCACENSQEVDQDRDLIDEKKVQEKYQEVKEDLKEVGKELDSTGQKIG